MKLTNELIEEIAEGLECGMRCFYNQKTGELKTSMNETNWGVSDSTMWYDDEEEGEEDDEDGEILNWMDYFEFEGLDSASTISIMSDFADSIHDSRLQAKLHNALNRPKPFKNFKWEIDNSGETRNEWFQFRRMRFIEWVKIQIETENRKLKL
jgi:hypothetical protein